MKPEERVFFFGNESIGGGMNKSDVSLDGMGI